MTNTSRLAWFMLAFAATAGCTFNGKKVGWPGGGGGTGAGAGPGAGAGAVPAWCNVEGVDRLDPLAVKYTVETTEANSALRDLAGHFCNPSDASREGRTELEAARARWSAQLKMTDADWRDAVEWALRPPIERNSPSLRVDDRRTLSSLDAIEQYALIDGSSGDKAYLADALEPRLTAIGRLAYIEDCLGRDEVGGWAICHADVAAFDVDAILAELRAASARSGYERITIRLKAFAAAPRVAERLAAVKQMIATDAGYATLFAAGEPVRAAWARRPADGGARGLALAMDDARRSNSRKAFAGCDDATWRAFAAAVGRLPARRFAELADEPARPFAEKAASIALDDPDVYLAANAMAICAGAGSAAPDYLVRTLAGELAFRPGHRGPRTATHSALLAAAIALDDRDARITYPAVERDWLPRNSGSRGGGKGVVASVDGGVITFAKDMVTHVECTKWKTTNRIDRIDRDGRIHYESHCVARAKRRYDKAAPPQTVHPRYLAAVRPRSYVMVTEDVVTGVWARAGDAAPAAVLGVALD